MYTVPDFLPRAYKGIENAELDRIRGLCADAWILCTKMETESFGTRATTNKHIDCGEPPIRVSMSTAVSMSCGTTNTVRKQLTFSCESGRRGCRRVYKCCSTLVGNVLCQGNNVIADQRRMATEHERGRGYVCGHAPRSNRSRYIGRCLLLVSPKP